MKIALHKTDKSSRRGEMYSFQLFREAVMHPGGAWLAVFTGVYRELLMGRGFVSVEDAISSYGVSHMDTWLKAFIAGVEMSVIRRPRLDWRGSELAVLTAICQHGDFVRELMSIIGPVMIKHLQCMERGRYSSIYEFKRGTAPLDVSEDVRELTLPSRMHTQLPILAEALLKTYEQWLASQRAGGGK